MDAAAGGFGFGASEVRGLLVTVPITVEGLLATVRFLTVRGAIPGTGRAGLAAVVPLGLEATWHILVRIPIQRDHVIPLKKCSAWR